MNLVFLNGKLLPADQAHVSVLDRGFIFGDGVYELVPVYSRVPFRLDEHLTRLERSLGETKIRNPYTRAQWRSHVYALIDAQSFEDQGVYFQVTRGVAKRDHAFPKDVAQTVFMMSNPLALPSREQVERGVAVVTADDNRWRRCDLKTTSLLGNVLMRQFAVENDAVETVMFRDGMLTEASASNVLVVIGGAVIAPPKDNLILPGITMDATFEFARDAGLSCEMRPVTKAEALAADEMWLSSSSKEVLAVTRVDGRAFGGGAPGPVFRRMWAEFQARRPRAAVAAGVA